MKKTIPNYFIQQAKRFPRRPFLIDDTGEKLNFSQALSFVLLLKKKIFSDLEDHGSLEKYGILLPPSCLSTLLNLVVLVAGHIPINLPTQTDQDTLHELLECAQCEKIITSADFIETAGFEKMASMIFLEDIQKNISNADQAVAKSFCLLPALAIRKMFVQESQVNEDSPATVIFSYGQEGKTKAILLSHRNVIEASNGLYKFFQVKGKDRLVNLIPYYQAFGFVSSVVFPSTKGITSLLHSQPEVSEEVEKMIKKHKGTILFTNPKLLPGLTETCQVESLKTLDFAVIGVERIRKTVSRQFNKKFGIVPFEVYGQPELSGIMMIGVPDYMNVEELDLREDQAVRSEHPFEGVQVKVVNPRTFKEVEPSVDGILLVKSPSLMLGYVNEAEEFQKTFIDGWFITRDFGCIDEEGRVHIRDRLDRFSRIHDELIPHAVVEDEILDVLDATDQVCVVTSLPDDIDGERLVVLYDRQLNVDYLYEKLLKRGKIPESWIPKEGSYYEVPEIPLLESGEIDLVKLKNRARLMHKVHYAGEEFVEVTIETEDGCLIALNHFRRGSKKVIILAHGWRNSKDTYLFKKMSGMFSLHYDVICFDFRGHGRSSGTYLWSAVECYDLSAVVGYAKRNDYEKVGVMGFSMGAATSLIEASQNDDIDSVIAVSGPKDFWKIDFNFWEPEMLQDIQLLMGPKGRGRDVRMGNPFHDKIRPIDIVDQISPTPVCFLHGAEDWLIKPYHSIEMYEKALEPKKLVMIEGAGHADKIYDTSSKEFEQACFDWFRETL